MPIYEFDCRECGEGFSVHLSIQSYATGPYSDRASKERQCENCGAVTARSFAFSIKTPMPDHFNRSAGEYVSSERALRDAFKRQSEAASVRTGIEHNFVPLDASDAKAAGVTSEGLDETIKRRRRLGMQVPKVNVDALPATPPPDPLTSKRRNLLTS
jgi:hypothetical protein